MEHSRNGAGEKMVKLENILHYIDINQWYLEDDLSIVEALIKYADVNKKAHCDAISEQLRGCPEDPLGFAVAGVDNLPICGFPRRPADMYQVNIN
jgi:hypothetical protein